MKKWLTFLILLLALNGRILHYEYASPHERDFSDAVTGHGLSVFSPELTLKKADYTLRAEGTAERGGRVALLNAAGEVLCETQISTAGDFDTRTRCPIEQTVTVRIAAQSEAGTLTLRKVRLTADGVLYKETLTRHLVMSAVLGLVFLYLHFRPRLKSREWETLILPALLVSLPFLLPGTFPNGNDIDFHLSRIEGLAAGLRAGIFPVKMYPAWLNGYGLPVGYFYPDLFLYPVALLRIAGFSVTVCYGVFQFVCTLSAGLTMYYTARRLRPGSERFAALLYITAAYPLISALYRCALGEVQAFVFYPLIVWGLYELFDGHSERLYIFAAGFLGLLSCHLLSLSIAVLLTACYLLCRLPELLRDRRIIGALLKATGAVLLLGLPFILPFLRFGCENPDIALFHMIGNKPGWRPDFLNYCEPWVLLAPFDKWDFADNRAHPYIGWPLLGGLIALLIRRARRYRLPLIFSILLLWASTSAFPWNFAPFAAYLLRLQFSWRLLAPATVLLSLPVGMLCAERKFSYRLVTLICLLSALPQVGRTIYGRSLPRATMDALDERLIHGYEYIPAGFDFEDCYRRLDRVETERGTAEVLWTKRGALTFRFAAEVTDAPVTFVLPIGAYSGYIAEFTSSDGGAARALTLSAGADGLLRVEVPESGTLRVQYKP